MRALISFLLISSIVFASLYDAQELYNKKQYHQAIKMAKASILDYPNPEIWARSAKALGNYIEAISAYERVVILEPNNIKIKKELLAIYIDLSEFKIDKYEN